jgi:hypothetical protein
MRLILLLLLLSFALGDTGCLNGSGQRVDWWVAFKLPYDRVLNPKGILITHIQGCSISTATPPMIAMN